MHASNKTLTYEPGHRFKLTPEAKSYIGQIYNQIKDIETKGWYFKEQITAIRSLTEKLIHEAPCLDTRIKETSAGIQFEMFEVDPP